MGDGLNGLNGLNAALIVVQESRLAEEIAQTRFLLLMVVRHVREKEKGLENVIKGHVQVNHLTSINYEELTVLIKRWLN